MKNTTIKNPYTTWQTSLPALLSRASEPKGKEKEETEEEKAERLAAADKDFDEAFNKRFHKAMKRYEEKVMDAVGKTVGEGITAALAKRDEEIAKKQEEEKAKGGGDPKDKGAIVPPEIERRMKAAEERAANAEKAQKEFEAKAKDAEERTLRNEELAEITNGITKRGIRGELVPVLAKDLAGKVKRDESGKIVYQKGEDDFLDLDKGLDEWMKSPTAKASMPATNSGGSGNRGAQQGAAGGKGKASFDQMGSMVAGDNRR